MKCKNPIPHFYTEIFAFCLGVYLFGCWKIETKNLLGRLAINSGKLQVADHSVPVFVIGKGRYIVYVQFRWN